MFQMIFVFKSSQSDVDTVIMEHQGPIITAISEQIGNQKVLQAVIDKHTETGQPLISILREENFLEEEQIARVIAAGNGIEFIDLSADMVDPIAAHMVTSEFANQHTLIPVTRADNKLRVAMSEPLNLIVMWHATHYLCAYDGPGSNGWAVVLTVNTGGWSISTETAFEYDDTSGLIRDLAQIDPNDCLCAYVGPTSVGNTAILTVEPADWTITSRIAFEYESTIAINHLRINE